jgi:NIPSNAP protein
VDNELDDALPAARLVTPPIVELRQYSLVPGCRDELVELFDKYFLDAQEDAGIDVLGQFLDLDDPDRFVWLRGFSSMSARLDGLRAFYGGPIWREHRDQANATMLDSDNVLLLRPVQALLTDELRDRPGMLLGALVGHLDEAPTAAHLDIACAAAEALASAGAEVLGAFASHDAENNFPGLPVRPDPVLVWITRHLGPADHARHIEAVTSKRSPIGDVLKDRQVLRLHPTPRSKLR